MALTCGICFEEDVVDVGVLDSCEHTFCFGCISRWLEEESRCPFCKKEVKRLTRKRLRAQRSTNAPKDSCTGARLNKRRGHVLEKVEIPEKRQVVEPDPADLEAMQELDATVCAECADGDNEALLILCDGCNQGFHTYCVGLDHVPEGDWFCQSCLDEGMGPEDTDDASPLREAVHYLEGHLHEMVQRLRRASPGQRRTLQRRRTGTGTVRAGRQARALARMRSRRQPGRVAGRTPRRSARIAPTGPSPAERAAQRLRRRRQLQSLLRQDPQDQAPPSGLALQRTRVETLRGFWEEIRSRGFGAALRADAGGEERSSRDGGGGSRSAERSEPAAAGAPATGPADTLEASWSAFAALRRSTVSSTCHAGSEVISQFFGHEAPRPATRPSSGPPSGSSGPNIMPATRHASSLSVSQLIGCQAPCPARRPCTDPPGGSSSSSVTRIAIPRLQLDPALSAAEAEHTNRAPTASPSRPLPCQQEKRPREGDHDVSRRRDEAKRCNATPVAGCDKLRRTQPNGAAPMEGAALDGNREAVSSRHERGNFKQVICSMAKAVLYPMLETKQIDRARFTEAAQHVTHRLRERYDHRQDDLTQAVVRHAVHRFLRR